MRHIRICLAGACAVLVGGLASGRGTGRAGEPTRPERLSVATRGGAHPRQCRGGGDQAARRRHAHLDREREPADESGQHHEAGHHLRGAALVRSRRSRSAPRCCPRRRSSAKSCAAICTCAAAAIPSWWSKTCGCWSVGCAASAFARSAAISCSTRPSSSRSSTTRPQFDGEEGRAYNVGPDPLLGEFQVDRHHAGARQRRQGGARRRRAGSRRTQGAAHRAGHRRRLRRLAWAFAGRHQRSDEHPAARRLSTRLRRARDLSRGARAHQLLRRGVPRVVGAAGRRVDRQGARGGGARLRRG